MGWSSDWLHELLLDRAREALEEAIHAAARRGEAAPELLIAAEHPEYHRKLNITSGEPTKIWSSEDDFRSLQPQQRWADLRRTYQNSAGSIFRVPLVSWFIAADRKQVLICKWIGPRYGVGGWWDVVGQGAQGQLRESTVRGGWIS